MDENTARIILYAITAVGVIVWVAGLVNFNRSYRMRAAGRHAIAERFQLNEPPPENVIFGSKEIDGEPAALAGRAASLLAKETVASIGQLKILECGDDRVAFEGGGHGLGVERCGRLLRRGQLRFARAASGRTRVDYGVELRSGRGALVCGAIALVLGFTALIVGFVVIGTYVVPHQDPAVRGQTFQMCQVVHFLWPPFLFAATYRRQYSLVQDSFDTFVHNLPYFSSH